MPECIRPRDIQGFDGSNGYSFRIERLPAYKKCRTLCYSQLSLFPPLRLKMSLVYQHGEHHPYQLMSRRKDRHLVDESIFPSFEIVGTEDLVGDDHLRRHEPDDPPEMAVSPLADLALSFVFA